MLLHGYHANGACGLPRGEECSGEQCGEAAERLVGKGSLSEGLIWGKGKMSFSQCQTIIKMVPTERV